MWSRHKSEGTCVTGGWTRAGGRRYRLPPSNSRGALPAVSTRSGGKRKRTPSTIAKAVHTRIRDHLRARESGLPGRLTTMKGCSSLRKIPTITLQQRFRLVLQKVNFAMELPRFTRPEAADARVVVNAHDHSLKQLLRFVPGHRQEMPVVARKTTDQSIDRLVGTDGARIDVVEVDARRHVNLSAAIERFLGPADFVERGQ